MPKNRDRRNKKTPYRVESFRLDIADSQEIEHWMAASGQDRTTVLRAAMRLWLALTRDTHFAPKVQLAAALSRLERAIPAEGLPDSILRHGSDELIELVVAVARAATRESLKRKLDCISARCGETVDQFRDRLTFPDYATPLRLLNHIAQHSAKLIRRYHHCFRNADGDGATAVVHDLHSEILRVFSYLEAVLVGLCEPDAKQFKISQPEILDKRWASPPFPMPRLLQVSTLSSQTERVAIKLKIQTITETSIRRTLQRDEVTELRELIDKVSDAKFKQPLEISSVEPLSAIEKLINYHRQLIMRRKLLQREGVDYARPSAAWCEVEEQLNVFDKFGGTALRLLMEGKADPHITAIDSEVLGILRKSGVLEGEDADAMPEVDSGVASGDSSSGLIEQPVDETSSAEDRAKRTIADTRREAAKAKQKRNRGRSGGAA